MDKFIVWLDVDGNISEPEKTRFDYEVGDVINVRSYGNQYKCINKIVNEQNTTYHFKQGKTIYTFNW